MQYEDAAPSPVDLLMQLDISGSMLDVLPAPVLTTKWDVVRDVISTFVQAPESAGTGIGLSYFPQLVSGIPSSCSANADCGAIAGPCSNSFCVQAGTVTQPGTTTALSYVSLPPGSTSAQFCTSDAECGAGQSCRTMLGECVLPPGASASAPNGGFLSVSADPNVSVSPLCNTAADCAQLAGTVCEQVGQCGSSLTLCSASVACAAGSGTCTPIPFTCTKQTRCEAVDYGTPSVPINDQPSRTPELLASLSAQTPSGLTPTGPALDGALTYAGRWAAQHPDRQPAVVFATDGLPTECTPVDVGSIAALASKASSSDLPVRTFVVGVFSTADLGLDGSATLSTLAAAGGTSQAFILDPASDLQGSLAKSLASIRALAGSCSFALDPAVASAPDRVSVDIATGTGSAQPLQRVDAAANCAASGAGWYFVRDGVGTPARIQLCPAACPKPDTGGRVRLGLGCAP